MDLKPLNLGQICRTCKCVTRQMRSLFEWYKNPHESPRFDEMLMACASVQVMCGDGLPSQICQICVEQLNNAFVFKRQCEKIDASLRKYAKMNKIKEELEISEFIDVENCFEPKVEVTESMDEEKIKEVAEFTQHNEESNVSEAVSIGDSGHHNSEDKENDSNEERRVNESFENVMVEEQEVKEEKVLVNFQDECDILGDSNKDHSDVDDCFEPKAEVTDSTIKKELKEVAEFTYDESNVSEAASIYDEDSDNNESKDDDSSEDKQVNESEDEEDILDDNSEVVTEDSGDSTDSEYLPEKSIPPKIKRGRGRPPKNGKKVEKEVIDEEYGEFPCPICQEMCTTMTQLDRHARLKHEGLKVHKCKECNREFKRAVDLRLHVVSHLPSKPLQCTVCTKSFSKRNHLNRHLELHKRSNVSKCDICQSLFSKAHNLAKHKFSRHGIPEKIMPDKKYECPHCHKGFTTEKYKDNHFNGHKCQRQFTCNVCKKIFLSKAYLVEHMKNHNEHAKKFVCLECDQRFIRRDYLAIHMRRHRGETPFKCKYCNKGFSRTTDVTRHEKSHTGEKTHFCTICGKGFGRPYLLTRHMRTHTGEKPYQCTYCDAAFAQDNDLKAHVRRHTGERFHCELCTKSFLLRHLLTQHKRTVHGLNVESKTTLATRVVKKEDPDEPHWSEYHFLNQ